MTTTFDSVSMTRETLALAGAALGCAARIVGSWGVERGADIRATNLRVAGRVVGAIGEPCPAASAALLAVWEAYGVAEASGDDIARLTNEAIAAAWDAIVDEGGSTERSLVRVRAAHRDLAEREGLA